MMQFIGRRTRIGGGGNPLARLQINGRAEQSVLSQYT